MIWGWAALASPHLAPAGSPYPKTQNSLHADAAIQCRDAFFRENLVTQQIFGRALAHFFGYGPKGITMEDLRRPLWPKMVELLMADDGITKLAKIPMKNAVSCSHIFQYIYIFSNIPHMTHGSQRNALRNAAVGFGANFACAKAFPLTSEASSVLYISEVLCALAQNVRFQRYQLEHSHSKFS